MKNNDRVNTKALTRETTDLAVARVRQLRQVPGATHVPVTVASERWLKRIARVVLPALVTALTVQPLAYAAPSPSLLVQEPRFLEVRVEPNVVFMMDDSNSMNDTRLPVPSDRNPSGDATVQIRGWFTGLGAAPERTPQVNTTDTNGHLSRARDNDWIHRSSTLNPLYYNPAIVYRPWNDNGRLDLTGATNTFPQASTATTVPGEGFVAGLIRQDMRYRGANYFYSATGAAGNDRTAFTSASGANPDHLSAVFTTPARPPRQGFEGSSYPAGAATPTHNQDIFSAPLRRVTGITTQCFPASSATDWLSFDRRTVQANRDTGQRSTYAIQTVNRTQPSLVETKTRNTFDISPITGSRTEVTNLPPPIDRDFYSVTTSDRTSPYQITTVNRPRDNNFSVVDRIGSTSVTRTSAPVRWRVRLGAVCGQGDWSDWTYETAPNLTCRQTIDENSAGGTQSQQSRVEACPTGTQPGPGNTCDTQCTGGDIVDVPALGGLRCFIGGCGDGFEVNPDNKAQCRRVCNGNVILVSGSPVCFTGCVADSISGFAPVGSLTTATTCSRTCPGGEILSVFDQATGTNVNRCFTTCPVPDAVSGYEIDPTAPSTCRRTCNSSNSSRIGDRCYTACTNPSRPVAAGVQCVANCDGGEIVGTRCFTGCANSNQEVNPSDPTVCRPSCTSAGGNIIGGVCYTGCPAPSAGFTEQLDIVGNATTSTQCRSRCTGTLSTDNSLCLGGCPNDSNGRATDLVSGSQTQCKTQCSGTNRFVSGTTCLADCLTDGQQPLADNSTTCAAACPPSYPNVSSTDATKCLPDCGTQGAPAGAADGAFCRYCDTGSTAFGSPTKCCPNANYNGTDPVGQCPFSDQTLCSPPFPNWVADPVLPALAYYYIYLPGATVASGGMDNPANYVLVEINRRDATSGILYPRATTRTDCTTTDGACTWAEEAQNFANWFTYYRTRLFSAIATSAEALSNLRNGRDQIRLGYGSINYFPGGTNPFNPTGNSLPTTMTIDGQTSVGHLVRGVRPFREELPPPVPGSNSRRQEVFDWLFSLRATGATPNREALDAIGRYFSRSDDQGPWITPNGKLRSGGTTVTGRWSSDEGATEQISCRRSYAIMVTDGEWTNRPSGQPLVENRSGTALNALTTTAPQVTQLNSNTADFVPYSPTLMPQFGGGNGNTQTGTLTDIALLYWSRDLRTDLRNNVQVVTPSAVNRQGDPAFWQHMQPYLIGYGISASMDTAAVRDYVAALSAGTTPLPAQPSSWPWPQVQMNDNVITDRDAGVFPPLTGPLCNCSATTNPSGCGRVNDTMRAALAGRGDFLAAPNVSLLAQGIANAFSAIAQIDASASSFGGRSGTLTAGDRLFQASFRTQSWTGRVDSFNAQALLSASTNGTAEPSSAPDRVGSNFPAWDEREIFTATARQTGVVFPETNLDGLTTDQKDALLNSVDVLQWLRGNHAGEVRNGGVNGRFFRNRDDGAFLADIINSTPVYSQAGDAGYSTARKPDALSATAAAAYSAFVTANRQHRRPLVMVGANGGMFHAFDAFGSPEQIVQPGNTVNPNYNANYMREVFAYVPRAMYPLLSALTEQGYVHRYYVDGQVVEGDVFTNGVWRKVVVGTSGAGPKSIFALDVTMRNNTAFRAFRAEDVLWDIDVTADNPGGTDSLQHVGHIMAPGVIAGVKGEANKFFYLVGNGYESAEDEARLLAIDMSTGQIAAALETDGAGGSNPAATTRDGRPNGLGAITPVYDASRNVVAVYAGDRLGRLWKFDLSEGLSSTRAKGQLLFDTIDNPAVTLDSQPITAAPRVMAHPLGGRFIVFGTGRFIEEGDYADLSVQSVYGIREEQPTAATVQRVTWAASPPATTKSIYGSAANTGLTLSNRTQASSTQRFRVLENTDGLDWTEHSGWFFDLKVGTATGERVLVTPIDNFGFANVTTFEPVAGGDRCQGGGASFFYRLDIAGTFTRAPFSQLPTFSGDTQPNVRTVVGSEVPALIGAPTLLSVASPPTSATLGSLDSSALTSLTGSQRTRAAATDPCAAIRAVGRTTLNRPVAGLPLSCPIPPLRVWRELPRGPR